MLTKETAENLPPSHKTSPAIHLAARECSAAFLKLVEVLIQHRKIEPLAAMQLGLSDEVLEAYSLIDKEDLWELDRLGMSLMIPRIRTVDGVRDLIANGFSSAQLVASISRDFEVATNKIKAR